MDNGSTFGIDELAERAAAALAGAGTVPPSARVTALPDRRMLRYYTTLGLLDRPVEIRGRTALYGRRHLLQIVAIKRLQSTGASLAEIQRRLAGASTADLEHIADFRADGAATPPFWQADSRRANRSPATESAPRTPAVAPAAAVAAAVRLAPGVTLVVDATRPLSAADHEGVRTAARPLLDQLTARGLLAAEPQER